MSDDSQPPGKPDGTKNTGPVFPANKGQSSVGATLFSYATGTKPIITTVPKKPEPAPRPPEPEPPIAPAAPPTQAMPLEQGMSRAMQLAEEGKIEEALAICSQLSATHPTNSDVCHLSGILTLQSGDAAAAVTWLERAVALEPDYVEALINLAIAKVRTNDHAGAEPILERTVTLAPDSWEASFNFGNFLLEMGKSKAAVAPFQNAARLRPDDNETLIKLAAAQRGGGQLQDAADSLERLVAANPTDVLAMTELADIFIDLEAHGDAEQHLRRAIALAPTVPGLHGKLGYVLLCQNSITESIEATGTELQRNPGVPDLLINYGYALLADDQSAEAVAKFKEAVRHAPDSASAWSGYGVALVREHRQEEALPHLRKAVDLEPENTVSLFYLASGLRATANYEDAASIYRRGLALEPDYAAGHWELGHSLDMSDDVDGAIAAYDECLALEPDNPIAGHLRAALVGDTPPAAAPAYVADLFDDYADGFEHSLVEELEYSDPQKFRAVLDELVRTENITTTPAFGRTLDLGCGTGLVGDAIHDLTGELTGLDVAEKMLEVAAKKGVYRSLRQADVVADMSLDAAGDAAFDLVTAADFFPYVGDLSGVFQGVRARLAPGGWFIFSTEAADEGTYLLRRSGRFSHSEEYIREQLANADLHLDRLVPSVIRNEGEEAISGFLCLAQAGSTT